MSSRRPLESALRDLVEALERDAIPYMLIGGVATTVRAAMRFTGDIDATILLAPERVPSLIARLSPRVRAAVRRPAAFASEHGVIPLVAAGGVRIDLLLAAHAFERGALRRATKVRVYGLLVRVCTAEDLVVYKMGALRPLDIEDVQSLLAKRGSGIDRRRLDRKIRALARDLGREEILEVWRALFRRRPRAR